MSKPRFSFQDLADILDDAHTRLHVLEYHLAQLEAYEIVAGTGQTSASK